MSRKKTHEERLSDKYVVISSGCWQWTGAKHHLGYGMVAWWEDGRVRSGKAHRMAYEVWIGPIPEGKHVMHTCDNPGCVNPAHLRLGMHADNMHDMAEKRRRQTVPIEVRMAIAQSEGNQRDIAARFGVSQSLVSRIVNGDKTRAKKCKA